MISQESLKKRNIDGKVAIATTLIAGGLIFVYLSFIFYALNWRVANEPGYDTVWYLLAPAIALSAVGGLAFLGGHIYILLRRAWLMLPVAWALCIVITVSAASLAPILLLFMV